MIEADCVLTERDFVRAHYVHMKPRTFFRYLGWALITVFAVVLVFSGSQLRKEGLWYPPFWYMVFPAAYLAFSFLYLTPRRLRRLYRQSAQAGRPYRLGFSSSTFTAESQTGRAEVPWSDFRKWKEGKTVLLLYNNDAMFNIVPKSCLTPDQLALLRQILTHHLRRVA